MNLVAMSGNLVSAPILRKAGDSPVLEFSIAVNEWRKAGQEYTSYFDVSLFGRSGEALFKIIKKGSKVWVQGHLRQRRWSDSDGTRHSAISIIAEHVEIPPLPKKTTEDVLRAADAQVEQHPQDFGEDRA